MRSEHVNIKQCLISLLVCLVILVGGMAGQAIAAGDKIKIGVLGPMKFPYGKDIWLGASAAAEEINAAGGVSVGGKMLKIESIKADSNDYQSITDAVNTTKRLITVDKVNFLIGGGRSEAVLAQMDVWSDYKIIYMVSGGGTPVIHMRIAKQYDKYKYLFNPVPNGVGLNRSWLALVDMAGNAIRKELGIAKPKVALVMEKAKWCDAVVKAAKGILPKIGYEVCGVWRPSPMATDVTAELTAVKAAGAHIIYQVFTGPVGIILNKQVGELKIPAVVVGLNYSGNALGRKYWDETNGMCEYEIGGAVDYSKAEITKKTKPIFNLLSKKIGGELPGPIAYSCYDNVYLLKGAIERAGTLDSDALVVELEKADYIGAQGRIIFPGKDHKWPHNAPYGPGYSTFCWFQWQNGELLPVWPDGRRPAFEKDPAWVGLKYKGTVAFKLPPQMIKYWKKK